MNFRESFHNFFRATPENSFKRADDLTDYPFLFSTFEKRLEIAQNSSAELTSLFHDFNATFLQTEIGKEYRRLIQEKEDLQSVGNPSGEVGTDIGKINILDRELSALENSDEFLGYTNLKTKIEDLINSQNSQEEDLQKVA